MPYSWKPSDTSPKNTEPRRSFRLTDTIVILGAIVTPIIMVGAAIVGIIWFFFNLPLEVEKLVDKRLKDREVVERLAKIIRPSMIFNSSGSTITDLGALEYIDSVNVLAYFDKEKKVPTVIEVKPKKRLEKAPLLTSIDHYTFNETVERGSGSIWIYRLEPQTIAETVHAFRFRLEVLP